MNSRFSMCFLAAPLILCAMLGSGRLEAAPPNVLLITADDLGLQLSCYGDELIDTPHLDRLASDGVRFRTAYVSQASCSPSRSTMFTGLYPHGNGQYGLANANVGFRVHPRLIDHLLPNVLKARGYRTGIIGKLHVDPEGAFTFDVRHREGFGSRNINQQVEFARDFLSTSDEAPWFLMFNLFDPHVARERREDGSRGPQFFPDRVDGVPAETRSASDVSAWRWQQIDEPEQREKIAGYYNCVQRVDVAVGKLLTVLRQAGQDEETLIIFLGDHGPPFARGKTSCYEAGLRVPFLVRWPGVSKPHVSDALVGSVDIYPTILDAAGIKPSGPLHGRSLRPVLNPGNASDWRQTLVGEFHYHGASPFFPRRAITDGRYKLIHNLRAGEESAPYQIDGDQAFAMAQAMPPGHAARVAMERLRNPPEWELYDLETDPIEFDNLAADPSMIEIKSRLQASLRSWQDETADPFRDPEFRRAVHDKYR